MSLIYCTPTHTRTHTPPTNMSPHVLHVESHIIVLQEGVGEREYEDQAPQTRDGHRLLS